MKVGIHQIFSYCLSLCKVYNPYFNYGVFAIIKKTSRFTIRAGYILRLLEE